MEPSTELPARRSIDRHCICRNWVKHFIGDLVPHAEWLALHAPTPPLEKILTEYLPILPVKLRVNSAPPFVPKRLVDAVRKGIKLRNETAHAGRSIEQDTLEEILRAVRDLLYLLDIYAGHQWAIETIGHETIEAIKAETDAQREAIDKMTDDAR
jgi:hypothetical protein